MAMAHGLISIILLLNAFMGLAMASDEFHDAMSPSPSRGGELPRKLGKYSSIVPQAAQNYAEESNSLDTTGSVPSEYMSGEDVGLEGQKIQLRRHKHSVDKSVAGGGVIICSLATAFFVAIFCYIRATRRHKAETTEVT